MINVTREGHKCRYSPLYYQNGQKNELKTINYRGRKRKIKICYLCKTIVIGEIKKSFDAEFIIYLPRLIVNTFLYCSKHKNKHQHRLYKMHYRIGPSYKGLHYRYCADCNVIYSISSKGKFNQKELFKTADEQRDFLQYQVNHLFDMLAFEQEEEATNE